MKNIIASCNDFSTEAQIKKFDEARKKYKGDKTVKFYEEFTETRPGSNKFVFTQIIYKP